MLREGRFVVCCLLPDWETKAVLCVSAKHSVALPGSTYKIFDVLKRLSKERF
jgi:hypothetical protein